MGSRRRYFALHSTIDRATLASQLSLERVAIAPLGGHALGGPHTPNIPQFLLVQQPRSPCRNIASPRTGFGECRFFFNLRKHPTLKFLEAGGDLLFHAVCAAEDQHPLSLPERSPTLACAVLNLIFKLCLSLARVLYFPLSTDNIFPDGEVPKPRV